MNAGCNRLVLDIGGRARVRQSGLGCLSWTRVEH